MKRSYCWCWEDSKCGKTICCYHCYKKAYCDDRCPDSEYKDKCRDYDPDYYDEEAEMNGI